MGIGRQIYELHKGNPLYYNCSVNSGTTLQLTFELEIINIFSLSHMNSQLPVKFTNYIFYTRA